MGKRGYTILIIVLVLMAVGLSIIMTVNFLGIDEAKLSIIRRDSDLGLYLSTSCAEEALELIRLNGDTYIMPETRIPINFPGNVTYYCWYSIQGRIPNKYIRSRSDISNFPRPLEIKITNINPKNPSKGKITIGYWQEK